MRCPIRPVVLNIGIAVCLLVTPRTNAEDVPATLFLETCASCHTVGGGDLDGPDLLPATEWPAADLRETVVRMQEEYTDPLTAEQVDSLVALLQSGDASSRLEAAERGDVATTETGDATSGARLFFGDDALSGGGTPCFACHAFAGRGGTLAADLTVVAGRLGDATLRSVIQRPAFPFMKVAYLDRLVTDREALDLMAFLKAEAPVAAAPGPPVVTLGAAAGGAAIACLVVLGIWLATLRGRVRARMVGEAGRRRS